LTQGHSREDIKKGKLFGALQNFGNHSIPVLNYKLWLNYFS
jgi:hypothetical protein